VDKIIKDDLLTQSQFARRWGLSRQYISKLALEGSLPMLGKLVDVAFADQFVKRNGIGVTRLDYGRDEREQYLKRLEKRRGLVGLIKHS
jgi:hypothetical protein